MVHIHQVHVVTYSAKPSYNYHGRMNNASYRKQVINTLLQMMRLQKEDCIPENPTASKALQLQLLPVSTQNLKIPFPETNSLKCWAIFKFNCASQTGLGILASYSFSYI